MTILSPLLIEQTHPILPTNSTI